MMQFRTVAAFVAAVAIAACRPADSPPQPAQPAAPAAVPQSREMGGAKSVMTFFVTSRGSGRGGDLGGLAGADAHCQALAQAEGAGDQAPAITRGGRT
jgi:hypothetical protein